MGGAVREQSAAPASVHLLQSTGPPPTQRTPPQDMRVSSISLCLPHPLPLSPAPLTALIQEACPHSSPSLVPPPGRGGPRARTPRGKGLLSLTPRTLPGPQDLWTLIFPDPQLRPFLPSGLSGCLSPTPSAPLPPPLVFNLEHPSAAS